jgi:hypothetical protein
MISQPSIPRLLESIRDELADKIKPALADPTLRVNVDMMMAVLNALVVRTEHEIDWMRAEADAAGSCGCRRGPRRAALHEVPRAHVLGLLLEPDDLGGVG